MTLCARCHARPDMRDTARAFEHATHWATAQHIETCWSSVAQDKQPVLQLYDCEHHICIKCAIELTYSSEDRRCPACACYSIELAEFVDLALGYEESSKLPAQADTHSALIAHLSLLAIRGIGVDDECKDDRSEQDDDGSAADDDELLLRIERSAARRQEVAKHHVRSNACIQALVCTAAQHGWCVDYDESMYTDGLVACTLKACAPQNSFMQHVDMCLEIIPITKSQAVFDKHMSYTNLPPWVQNALPVQV